MIQASLLRNGVQRKPMPTLKNIQPKCGLSLDPSEVPAVLRGAYPHSYDPYRNKLIPSAVNPEHTRLVLAKKPYPIPRPTTGVGASPRALTEGMRCSEGYGRGQREGLAYMIHGYDRVHGSILQQSDNFFAGLNSDIPLPK